MNVKEKPAKKYDITELRKKNEPKKLNKDVNKYGVYKLFLNKCSKKEEIKVES